MYNVWLGLRLLFGLLGVALVGGGVIWLLIHTLTFGWH